jgi:hypothetical protein
MSTTWVTGDAGGGLVTHPPENSEQIATAANAARTLAGPVLICLIPIIFPDFRAIRHLREPFRASKTLPVSREIDRDRGLRRALPNEHFRAPENLFE